MPSDVSAHAGTDTANSLPAGGMGAGRAHRPRPEGRPDIPDSAVAKSPRTPWAVSSCGR